MANLVTHFATLLKGPTAMIGYQMGKRCVGCLLFATREIVDEFGERQALCDRCPTPDEIRDRTAEIRAGWDEVDYVCRQHGLSREAITDRCVVRVNEVAMWPCAPPARRAVMTI